MATGFTVLGFSSMFATNAHSDQGALQVASGVWDPESGIGQLVVGVPDESGPSLSRSFVSFEPDGQHNLVEDDRAIYYYSGTVGQYFEVNFEGVDTAIPPKVFVSVPGYTTLLAELQSL
ncbi:hypothetical protein [Pseudoclavibacter sp. JSM 162008]|uniref:hypothetical protein n=1 Tax=Pseudoclavibacter sp. JSM 162008 TaxID=3229855 RepID=UPI0035239FBA